MTSDQQPQDDEKEIHDAWSRDDFNAATSLALRRYGGEVLGFLSGILRDYDLASDAFELLQERLWTSSTRFEWKCSMRTWVYRLARNAAADVRRGGAIRASRGAPLSSSRAEFEELAARVRTETLSILRTERRTALESLYDGLSDEDRELVVLRAARSMRFRDIATVLGNLEDPGAERTVAQECIRLRKRYQLVRDRLRKLGKERGLL